MHPGPFSGALVFAMPRGGSARGHIPHCSGGSPLERLDLLIAYRRILMYIVMYDEIRHKPGQRASWRRMILSQPEVMDGWPKA